MKTGAVYVEYNISFVGELEWYNNSAGFDGGKTGKRKFRSSERKLEG